MENITALNDDELENVNGGVMDMRSNAMNLASGMIDQDNQCRSINFGSVLPVKGINKQVNTAKNVIREN